MFKLLKENSKPWDEDDWLYLMINGTVFRNMRYCARCIFTTVDPSKGEKRADGEPLKTLKEIRMSSDPEVRKVHNAPYFGILLATDHPGKTISQGGQVYVIKRNKILGEYY